MNGKKGYSEGEQAQMSQESNLPYRATLTYFQAQNDAIRLINEARMRRAVSGAPIPAPVNRVSASSYVAPEPGLLERAGSLAVTGFLGLLAIAVARFVVQRGSEEK